ncbi:MAG: hypothetical protein QXY76_02685 [Nitrososphaeria archaeon]
MKKFRILATSALLCLLLFSILPIIPVEEQVIVGYSKETHPSKFEVVKSYLEDLIDRDGSIVGARFHVIVKNLDNRNIVVNIEFIPRYSSGFPATYVLQGYGIKKGETADLYYDFVVDKSVINIFGKITAFDYRVIDGSPLIEMVPVTEKRIKYYSLIDLIGKSIFRS